MSKILNKTKKISVSMLFFIALLAIIVTSINASITSEKTTVMDLIKEAQNDSWYNYSPSKDMIGKKIGITASNSYNSAYCIDGHTPKDNGNSWGGYYDIVNVFDVNNNKNTVVVYSIENPNGTEYSLSDERIKPILMLSYLTQKATENSSDLTAFGYKDVLSRIFWNATWIRDLKAVGLSSSFHAPYTLNNGNLVSAARKIAEAKQYAENMMAQGAIETAELSDSVMTEAEKSRVSVTKINGKTFIGPYRINLKATKVGEIKVNGENAIGISTDMKTVESFDKIVDAKEFYIVTEKDYNEIKSITVKANKTISTMKSRMVLLGNSPSQNFLVWKSEETTITPEVELETPKTGTLEIQKVDENKDSTISLKDIEFKVYAEKKGWVEQNGENITFNNEKNAFDKVKPFKTDSKGKISIKNLPTGYYWIYETGLPENLQGIYELGETKVPGKDDFVKAKRVVMKKGTTENDTIMNLKFSVSAGQTATVTAVNSRAYTDVTVHKTDKDTGKALNGYVFRLYRIDGNEQGWVRAENNVVLEKDTYTKDFTDAKIANLTTTNGITQTLKKLPVGTYELYETAKGENGEVYDLGKFKKDNNEYDGKLIDTQEVKANATGVFTFEVENVPVFIKISGKVWEDNLQGKNKQTRDGVFTASDKLIEGIEVILFDRQKQQRVSTFTDENGEYTFENVRIRASEKSETADYLKYYVIMFKYDGFIYESTIESEEAVKRYNDDGSINETTPKAFDLKDMRNKLNNKFKDITGEGQVLSDGVQLKYNKSEDGITLENTAKRVETSNGVKLEGTTDFSMTAVTTSNILMDYYEKLKAAQDVVTEIKHINFGVYQREMPNLTLQKDIARADVSINGYTYTYNYNQKLKMENPSDTSLGVKFDEDYRLPIYKADAKYTGEGKGLQATITYKIKLQNASSNLYAEIKEINEVFSDELEYSGEMYLSENSVFGDDSKKIEGTYKDGRITLSESVKLKPFDNENGTNTKYLYIKFKIRDINALYNIAEHNSGETPSGLENKAEISKYSIYSDEFKTLYAGIDSTSIPNNHKTEHEDDDDKAPGLKIVDAGQRTVSGTVFEDAVLQDKLNNNNERIGNGIFEVGEKTIKGVKVQLVDNEGNKVAQVYNGSGWVDADAISTENGNFTISGFLPGAYRLVYTWGDANGYKVEDYKGTIYVNSKRANDVKWYKDEGNRYSDAIDNYNMRLAIDYEALELATENYTSAEMQKINKIIADYGGKIIEMKSTTPAFEIGIEKDEYTQTPEGNGFKFEVENIDFGIIERPRQVMNIKKDLRGIVLTTNDGQQVVNAEIDKDGKLKVRTGEKYVSGGNGLPYIWVQVDKNITTGMAAKLKYAITVSNDSEKDYDDENYYKFGTIDEESKEVKMKLRAENVYDICSGAVLLAEDKVNTNTWTTVGKDEFKNLPKTMTENYFTENLITDEDGYITGGNWEKSSVISTEILNEWMDNITSTKTVRSVRIPQNAVIMKYASEDGKLLREMEPGESETAEIVTSKELANGDNIRFDNDVEITNIVYSTNQKTGRKPSANTSRTYDRAEWTTITPATGEDRDYTWIIITAVSAIAVLGAGIIIIKKKVLK